MLLAAPMPYMEGVLLAVRVGFGVGTGVGVGVGIGPCDGVCACDGVGIGVGGCLEGALPTALEFKKVLLASY